MMYTNSDKILNKMWIYNIMYWSENRDVSRKCKVDVRLRECRRKVVGVHCKITKGKDTLGISRQSSKKQT